jgi:hypothetical protein
MPAIDPESLLEHCATQNCAAIFVPSAAQVRLIALGKAANCPTHKESVHGQPSPWRNVHQLTPAEAQCDVCHRAFVANPRRLVWAKIGAGRLLCPRCGQAWQHEKLLICPVCCRLGDTATLQGCAIRQCVGQSVAIQRRSIPALVSAPLPAELWRAIVEKSGTNKNPAEYRRKAVSTRVGWARRGKSQRWGVNGAVVWR